jgi:hypothetical protein
MELAMNKELLECGCRSTERAQTMWVKKIIDEFFGYATIQLLDIHRSSIKDRCVLGMMRTAIY